MKNKLKIEDYKLEHFMICNYINISKVDLEEIFANYGEKLNKEILQNENPNLFLNILFGKEKKANIHLFLNDQNDKFEIKEKDHELINSFYNKFIISESYLDFENNPDRYYINLYNFLEKSYNDFKKDEMKSINKENESIQKKDKINSNKRNNDVNFKKDYNESIIQEIDKEFTKKLNKYVKWINEMILHCISYFLRIKKRN